MSPSDLIQVLHNHLTLSRHVKKLRDKIKVIVVLYLKALQIVFRQMPNVSDRIEKKALNMINCWGVVISVDGTNYFLRDYESFTIACSSFERWIWTHLSLRDGETFVDVGAHIGKYALPLAKRVGEKGQVIAVEADPDNFEALKKGIRINGLKNVRALNLAAWNRVEKLRLHLGISSGRSSIKEDRWLDYVQVEAAPLDRVLKEAKVDWIKIDVEGAELQALEGLKNTLERHRPKVIAEVTKINIKKVTSFMRKRGYMARTIYIGRTGDHILYSPEIENPAVHNA